MGQRISGYCWEKAASYGRQADEQADPELGAFFDGLRNAWINAANRAVMLEVVAEQPPVQSSQ